MLAGEEKKLGKFRTLFWPIHKAEYVKFIPMFIIFFLISFNYNLLRTAKDTMMITAPKSGAEVIPYIKLWVMLPMAFLMTMIYTKLSNKWGRLRVFYSMISIFLAYFALFTFVLYPFRDILHPHGFADTLATILPAGMKGFISLIRNWTFTSFYVMSELWGAIVLTVLFWGFANDVTSVREAKRFYALFMVGANVAGVIAGRAAVTLSSNLYQSNIFYGSTAWEQTVLFLNLTVIVIGLMMMLTFRFLMKKGINSQLFTTKRTEVPSPEKMSLRKNFSYIMKSKYLIGIAIIVLSYNVTINLVEVLWKNQIKELYSDPSHYQIYMGHVTTIMGLLATVISLFLSGNLLRKFSWTFNALIPPLIAFVTAMGFFAFSFFIDSSPIASISAFFGSTPIFMSVFFGSLQNCMCRASKYTLFDATKEISFIPLSPECKTKGKAAIDGVGSRIGKSGGAVIYQGLLIPLATLSACTPIVAIIFLCICLIWVVAAKSLGKQFNSLIAQNEKLTIPEPKVLQTEDKTLAGKTSS